MYVCTPKRVTKLTDAAAAEVVVVAAAAAAEATLALTCDRAALQLTSSAWGTFSRMPTFHGLSQTFVHAQHFTLTQCQLLIFFLTAACLSASVYNSG